MEPWYKVTLSHDDVLQGKVLQLKDDFLVEAANKPVREAVVVLTERAPDMSSITCWFSPIAACIARNVIEKWNGIPCLEPTPTIHLQTLIGTPAALQAIFAQKEGSN
jgi:hypothetical protein